MMKFIILSIGLISSINSSSQRLLQQATCETVRCPSGTFCTEDSIAGTQCVSCAATTCTNGQSCVEGVGCSFVCDKENEEYTMCGSACPAVCGVPSLGACITLCVEGCFCEKGFIRDTNGECIPESECQPSCGTNEIFTQCNGHCRPTCETGPDIICTRQCEAGCNCEDGYILDKVDGTCIPEKDCPAKGNPGDVCGMPPTDCPAMKCLCGTCPDGINEFGCCSDCVFDADGICQSISSCPTCKDTVCANKGEFCIEDDLSGPKCTSCAAITCGPGQACIDGIGCQPTITCANILCTQDSPYCIYDDINGPRCVGVCECNTDADCETGYECLETPVGFEGCDTAVTDSCFGFCSKQGQSCGGFVGNALCEDPEICISAPIGGPGTQPVGSCYSLQETCNDPITCANIDCQPGDTCIDDPVEGPQCVAIRECGGIDYCTSYIEDNCNTCNCDGNGLESCTEKACLQFVPPELAGNRCEICIDGYSPSDDRLSCQFPADCICTKEFAPVCCNGYTYANSCTAECAGCTADQISDGGCTEIPSCGGIDYCTSYKPDTCNTCSCGDREFPICTLAFCPPGPDFQPTCNACVDGYKPSADGLTCEPDLGCFCPLIFDPVCCDGQTYGNSCQANCAGCSGLSIPGACPQSCAAITCGPGQKCVELGANGGKCVDENVCCDPQEIVPTPEIPFPCFEGCQCCPDGEWSGSIGDGKTFCGGLVLGIDEFGEVCDDGNNGGLKECTTNGVNSECSTGYKCRPNPNCTGNQNSCSPNKVCLDRDTGSCSCDTDCSDGYSCIGNNGNGNCVKFEEP